MQILVQKPQPVHVENVPDVFFQESIEPIFASVPDNYIAEYTAFVCHSRDVHVQLLLCSADEVVAHINRRRVRGRIGLHAHACLCMCEAAV
jgi:hypothetical protein